MLDFFLVTITVVLNTFPQKKDLFPRDDVFAFIHPGVLIDEEFQDTEAEAKGKLSGEIFWFIAASILPLVMQCSAFVELFSCVTHC